MSAGNCCPPDRENRFPHVAQMNQMVIQPRRLAVRICGSANLRSANLRSAKLIGNGLVVSQAARILFWLLLLLTGFGAVDAGAAEPVADFRTAAKLFQEGQYGQCVGYTTQAIEDGNYGDRWFALKLRAQLIMGQYSEAEDTLRQGLAVYDRSLQLKWLAIDVLRFSGRAGEVRRTKEEFGDLASRSWRYRDADSQVLIGPLRAGPGARPEKGA